MNTEEIKIELGEGVTATIAEIKKVAEDIKDTSYTAIRREILKQKIGLDVVALLEYVKENYKKEYIGVRPFYNYYLQTDNGKVSTIAPIEGEDEVGMQKLYETIKSIKLNEQ